MPSWTWKGNCDLIKNLFTFNIEHTYVCIYVYRGNF